LVSTGSKYIFLFQCSTKGSELGTKQSAFKHFSEFLSG